MLQTSAPDLTSELAVFEQLRAELLATAPGQYVLIHGAEAAGTYPTAMAAVNAGYARFGHVPFLVKQIVPVDTPAQFATPMVGA
jgi:hypothetical protein